MLAETMACVVKQMNVVQVIAKEHQRPTMLRVVEKEDEQNEGNKKKQSRQRFCQKK
jgi:hypothetical protein